MPRAHRYFLPGYVWHITHPPGTSSNRSRRSTASLGAYPADRKEVAGPVTNKPSQCRRQSGIDNPLATEADSGCR